MSTAPSRPPRPGSLDPAPPRLWPNLPAATQAQIAQLLAALLRRPQPDRHAAVAENRRADRRGRS
jgi:hypothetical protein